MKLHDDDSGNEFNIFEEVEDDAESDALSRMKALLEREWSRREVSMEYFYKLILAGELKKKIKYLVVNNLSFIWFCVLP